MGGKHLYSDGPQDQKHLEHCSRHFSSALVIASIWNS